MPGQINYLRISITDRCNLRCFYCTPWGGWRSCQPRKSCATKSCCAWPGWPPGWGSVSSGSPAASPWCAGASGIYPRPAPGSRDRGSLPHHQRRAPGGTGPGPPGHRLAPPQPQPGQPAPGPLPGAHRRRPLQRRHGRPRAGRGPGFCPHQDQLRGLERLKRRRTPGLRPPDPRPPLPGALHRIHAHGG